MLGTNKTSSSLRPDYATQFRIKAEDKLYSAENYDKQLKYIGVSTDWFESQQKREVNNKKKLNDTRIKRELLHTNEEIKLRRRERLFDLYYMESDIFERELSERGLAIVKER